MDKKVKAGYMVLVTAKLAMFLEFYGLKIRKSLIVFLEGKGK